MSDFWDDTEMWAPISKYGSAVQKLLKEGSPGLMRHSGANSTSTKYEEYKYSNEELEFLRKDDIFQLWNLLTVLSRNYEELQREWFLPTESAHYTGSL